MTTSPSTDYVTKAEFEHAMGRIDAQFVTKSEFQLAMANIDTRFAQIETVIERATVTSIRWTVGIALGQYALLFGAILFFIAREIPHA